MESIKCCIAFSNSSVQNFKKIGLVEVGQLQYSTQNIDVTDWETKL